MFALRMQSFGDANFETVCAPGGKRRRRCQRAWLPTGRLENAKAAAEVHSLRPTPVKNSG